MTMACFKMMMSNFDAKLCDKILPKLLLEFHLYPNISGGSVWTTNILVTMVQSSVLCSWDVWKDACYVTCYTRN